MKLKRSILSIFALPFLLGACAYESEAVGVGEWTKAIDRKIKVVEVKDVKTIPAVAKDFTAKSNYIVVLVEFFNESSSKVRLKYDDFELYKEDIKYSAKGLESWYYSENQGDHSSLYTTVEIDSSADEQYYLVFETPTAHTEDSYQLRYTYSVVTVKINL